MKQHIKTHKLGKVESDDMDSGTNIDYIQENEFKNNLITKSDVGQLALPFHNFHAENLPQ